MARRALDPRLVAGRTISYIVLIALSLVYIYPFVIQLANTFKTEPDAAADPLSPIPDPFTSHSFIQVFSGTGFPRWLFNSVLITILVTVGRVFFDSLAGYALARCASRGGRALRRRGGDARRADRGPAHPEVPGAEPARALQQLFRAGAAVARGRDRVFIMKQSFESVPVSIEEAARIDGAGVFRTYWSVVLPTARPALITLTILSFQVPGTT
jgi:multiple sugar transport system permease protein